MMLLEVLMRRVPFVLLILAVILSAHARAVAAPDTNGVGHISCAINEKGKGFEVKASYPEAEGAANKASLEKFNRLVTERVKKEVETFKKQVREDAEYVSKSPAPWDFHLNYDWKDNSWNVISVLFSGSVYTGGAHPAPMNFTVNFDLREGREIALGELFAPDTPYLKTLSSFCLESLKKKNPDDEIEASGVSEKEENFKNFYITRDGITIFFPPYQVASYASGSKEVQVPLETLKNMLLPRYNEK
jgi:hypothetical protein